MENTTRHSTECNGQAMPSKTELLTSKQTAEYLDISMAQLYKLTSQRSIPFYQPTGGKLYFKLSEVNEWIWSHQVKTSIDLTSEANNHLLKIKKVA